MTGNRKTNPVNLANRGDQIHLTELGGNVQQAGTTKLTAKCNFKGHFIAMIIQGK